MNFDGHKNDGRAARRGDELECNELKENEFKNAALEIEALETDRSIDHALAQVAKAEPRPGLDGRVLARLRGAQEEPARKFWWWSVAAFGTAVAMVLVFVWIARMDSGSVPEVPVAKVPAASSVVAHSDRPTPAEATPGNNAEAHDKGGVSSERNPDHNAIIASADRHEAMPKLDHFPSRRNLSEQEWLLVRYLNERSNKERSNQERSGKQALLEATATGSEADLRAEADLSIASLEIRPVQISDIEISEARANTDRTNRDLANADRTNGDRTNTDSLNDDEANEDPTN